jgi:hypothetical protein
MTTAVEHKQGCAICRELSCSQQTRMSAALEDKNVSNAVLILSDIFAIIPSVGPLVRGHALVVTRRHSSNILASVDETGYREFREICKQYLDWSSGKAEDARLLCFEHGSCSGTHQSLCSTEHGHVHLLPLQSNESARVLEAVVGTSITVGDCRELSEVLNSLQQYVVAFSIGSKQGDHLEGVVLDGSTVPSQYLRRVVAERLGLPQWDWKLDLEMNSDLLREMLAQGFEINRNAVRW